MSDQSLILSLALKRLYDLRKWLQFSEVQNPPWQRRNKCSYFTVILWGLNEAEHTNCSAPSLAHNWYSLTRRYFYYVPTNPMDVSWSFLFQHCLVKEDNRPIQRLCVILQDQGLTFPGLMACCLFHRSYLNQGCCLVLVILLSSGFSTRTDPMCVGEQPCFPIRIKSLSSLVAMN